MSNTSENNQLEEYGWLELLSNNFQAKKLVFNRYRLSDLSYLNDMLFPTNYISMDKLELLTNNTYNKIKKIVTRDSTLSNNLKEHDYEKIKDVEYVKLIRDFIRILDPLPLQLVHISYDTSHLQKYNLNCTGELEIVHCLLNARELFKYASSCHCHWDELLIEKGFDVNNQDYHDDKKRYYISIDDKFSKERTFAINAINSIYTEKFGKK